MAWLSLCFGVAQRWVEALAVLESCWRFYTVDMDNDDESCIPEADMSTARTFAYSAGGVGLRCDDTE